jgi:hypothetical protein
MVGRVINCSPREPRETGTRFEGKFEYQLGISQSDLRARGFGEVGQILT